MKSIFQTEAHQEILNRINNLNEDTPAKWGKMNVGQMLKHCQLPFEVATGKTEMQAKASFLKKLLFKAFKPMMYNDKAWKPNMQTPKQFRVTDEHLFTSEKDNLVTLINEFHSKKDNNDWPEHPLFGHFTTEQRGKIQYKHLDHHLKQFGV